MDFKQAELIITMRSHRLAGVNGKAITLNSIESLRLALELGYDVLIFDMKERG